MRIGKRNIETHPGTAEVGGKHGNRWGRLGRFLVGWNNFTFWEHRACPQWSVPGGWRGIKAGGW